MTEGLLLHLCLLLLPLTFTIPQSRIRSTAPFTQGSLGTKNKGTVFTMPVYCFLNALLITFLFGYAGIHRPEKLVAVSVYDIPIARGQLNLCKLLSVKNDLKSNVT